MTAFNVPANPAFDSYPELVAAINDWLDRSDLDGVANQLIALAEDEMIAAFTPLWQEKREDVMTVDGLAALPTDYGVLSRVVYDGQALPQYSASASLDIPEGPRPAGYSLEANGIRVWPAGNFTLTLLYSPTLPRLTETKPSNLLLDKFPSLYFYGAMVFAHGYIADDQRAATFRGLFDNMMAQAKRYFMRQRHAGPLVARTGFVP